MSALAHASIRKPFTKICSSCGRSLPLENFGKRNNGKNGLTGKCIECIREYNRKWYDFNNVRVIDHKHNYNKTRSPDSKQKGERVLRLKILNRLSNPPKCSVCGIDDIRILDIDHINGGGYKERKIHRAGRAFHTYLSTLSDDELKSNYQILCKNHNWLKHIKKSNAWETFLDQNGRELHE